MALLFVSNTDLACPIEILEAKNYSPSADAVVVFLVPFERVQFSLSFLLFLYSSVCLVFHSQSLFSLCFYAELPNALVGAIELAHRTPSTRAAFLLQVTFLSNY